MRLLLFSQLGKTDNIDGMSLFISPPRICHNGESGDTIEYFLCLYGNLSDISNFYKDIADIDFKKMLLYGSFNSVTGCLQITFQTLTLQSLNLSRGISNLTFVDIRRTLTDLFRIIKTVTHV